MTLQETIVSAGSRQFRVAPSWPDVPDGMDLVEVAGVAIDSSDRVYVFNRGADPMAIFEPDGTFVSAWGQGVFTRAHNVFIGPDGSVYAVDVGDHSVRKCTPDGEVLMTLGNPGTPGDTGATTDYRTIQHGGPPFNAPTKAVLNDAGEIFVSDGYMNARVHHFSAEGELLNSWGQPGDAPGQFNLCHSIAVGPDGTLYVCDRENSRLQLFDQSGGFIEEWTDVSRPCDVYAGPDGLIYVAELGHKAGLALAKPVDTPGVPSLSVWEPGHTLVGRWGEDDILAPGSFFAPHGIALDSQGNLYVAEVTVSGDAGRGVIPPGYRAIQKFEPV